jgi:hypothetical protein
MPPREVVPVSVVARAVVLTLLAACAAILPAAASASGGAPVAQAAGSCKVPKGGRGLGPTYVTSLRVTGTSCSSGVKLVKAYYRCRVRNGGRKGTCKGGVQGFRCSEKRSSVITTQFDAKVSCRKGSARVDHSYTQFT